ncbi:hypothetical protein [Mycoplasmoides pirum]|uniref:hypothetical protein n=1 Tax=Mycoplasmoides pirum TaxID=2122 RepID=UPI0004842750|nr:hypothetical protein [Mycoplasmoides pirum]
MKKNKHYKFWLISFLLSIVLFFIVIFNIDSISEIFKNKNLDISFQNQTNNFSKNTNIVPKDLIEIKDLKITSQNIQQGKLSAEEATFGDNYILAATNDNNTKAKVVKLNYQMKYLYEWEFETINYHTRQIIADKDDIGYFYVLLVNNNLTISGSNINSANTSSFLVQNPAIVIQLFDNGSSFEKRNTYSLNLPDFKVNDKTKHSSIITSNEAANNIWDHIYVQEAIQSSDENSKLSFIRNTNLNNSSANSNNDIYINDNSKSVIYKLLSSEGKKNSNSENSTEQSYYILKQLYLNNANNMVYLKDKTTNKKMILLFGGNSYQNFWFYDFEVTISNSYSNYYVNPLLYANYNFDPYGTKYQDEVMYKAQKDRNNSDVLKNYFYPLFMRVNKISNLAWYVGGAKTITLTNQSNNQSESYVFLAMMQPNVSDFHKDLYSTNSNKDTNSIDQIKKGTFGTPTEVSLWNETNINSSNRPNYISFKNQNFNPQNDFFADAQKYYNKELLVGSSSINASYQTFSSPENKPWGSLVSNFFYSFTAIQSSTVLPVMTSDVASLICVKPQTSQNISSDEKIYLNTFLDLDKNTTKTLTNFSLFNSFPLNDKFYNFDFAKEMITNPYDWTQDIDTSSNSNYKVGYDDANMSRILLNKNPTKSTKFKSDGWENTASQKIIAFSPQLTSENVQTPYGTYKKVAATLIVRGYIYSFTYDFEVQPNGSRILPIANLTNKQITENDLKFTNILSISYINNIWMITFQDNVNRSGETLFYSIKYLPNNNKQSWNVVKNNILPANTGKISKIFNLANNNYLFIIKEDKNVNLINYEAGHTTNFDINSLMTDPSIWGTVSLVSSKFIIDSGLANMTPTQIVNDSNLLYQLIEYTGGWSMDSTTNKPTESPLIINVQTTSTTISFDVAIKFINGNYYTSANIDSSQYSNVFKNENLNIPKFVYEGFATNLVDWHLYVILGCIFGTTAISLLIIFLALHFHNNKNFKKRKKPLPVPADQNKLDINEKLLLTNSMYQNVYDGAVSYPIYATRNLTSTIQTTQTKYPMLPSKNNIPLMTKTTKPINNSTQPLITQPIKNNTPPIKRKPNSNSKEQTRNIPTLTKTTKPINNSTQPIKNNTPPIKPN